MIWHALIFSGVIITLLSYRKKRTISRMGIEETNIFERFFGTDFGVTLCACFTMLSILLFTLKADPTIPQLKAKQAQMDVAVYRQLGERLGKRAASFAPEGKVMVIARQPNEAGKTYHDALLEGLQANLGGKLQMGPIIYLEVLKQETTVSELERPFRLTNVQLDNFAQQNPNCSAIISLVGVEETFYASKVAIDTRSGKRAFLLVTDNFYMLGSAIANKCISYCVAPNPSYNAKNQVFTEDAVDPTFATRFIEVDQNNLKDVARKYRRMLYVTQRMN